jgi:hypothetical protein
MARLWRYEEGALHKAGVGANRPRVQRCITRMRVIMTAAAFSPAEATSMMKLPRLAAPFAATYVGRCLDYGLRCTTYLTIRRRRTAELRVGSELR